MELIKQPVKGMRDILPKEKALRDEIFDKIKKVYLSYGFNLIETPIVEHYENLNCNSGGENEKLTFHILKRGEKLAEAMAQCNELCDCGLRYDLTLPLCRYYSNNQENLPNPFKVFQFGDVFRADRPQKGRARQFKQCDLDIFGESGIRGEIELLSATSTFLKSLDNLDFTIKINDRRLLKAMCDYVQFPQDKYSEILIILDKMDKIGIDGVFEELSKLELDANACNTYVNLIKELLVRENKLEYLLSCLPNESETINSLQTIIDTIKEVCGVKIEFDFTIVRGMGYYTGTIYEIYSNNFGSAIGGGGRYDNLVGSFTNQQVPAVGVSIGFERLIVLLLESDFQATGKEKKLAVLFDDKISSEEYIALSKKVSERRKTSIVYLNKYMKNIKRQKESLALLGYTIIDSKEL